jgi:alanyl-tRNA synthetase
MTNRLYYDNAYLTQFEARVLERFPYESKFAVVLDRTAFYPTSGGQPFDRGTLGGVTVVDVVVRENDEKVLHILQDPSDEQQAEVLGKIDWDRRFDHMQQHTGQHILSQAFLQVAGAETVSFHLGARSATIDLSGHRRLSPTDMEQTEQLTNKVVWEDRPVIANVFHPSELDSLPLRKPPAVAGDVRVIQVADYDWSACGGTHVVRTGEVGMVKIIKWERRGDETRVEFRCGWRALIDYAQKNSLVNRLSAGFNVGHWELDQAVERLTADNKELRSQLRQAGRALSRYRATELREDAPSVAGVRLISYDLCAESLMDLRELARQLVSQPGVVAILGVGDRKVNLCFARSSDVDVDMVPLIRETAGRLGARGGGGKPDFAQGGGTLEKTQQLDDVLEWAAHKVRKQLTRAE